MQFSEITGLAEIKNKLLTALQNQKAAHAQLFVGKEGSAKLCLALAYISFLLCENPQQNDSCGLCATCQKNKKLIHPDVQFMFPVSSTQKIKGKDVISESFLTEWRSFVGSNPHGSILDWSFHFGGENKQAIISKESSRRLIKQMSLKSFEGGYKIALIWLPEYMHLYAANALLKLIEEPPEKTVFLLITENEEQLLNTICSRTQRVQIPAYSTDEIAQILLRGNQVNLSEAQNIARFSNGNLNKAMKSGFGEESIYLDTFKNWMRVVYMQNYEGMITHSEDFQKISRSEQKNLFIYALAMLRNTILSHYELHTLLLQSEEEKRFSRKFSQTILPQTAENIINQINQAYIHLERNANPKIIFLDLSLQLAKLMRPNQ